MWLKMIISSGLVAGCLLSCSTAKKTVQAPKPEKIELAPNDQDSTEYELIIIDPGFESWFNMTHKPVWYYSKDFLASWNYQYVVAWNAKARDPFFRDRNPDNPFLNEIDYRPHIDYGIDLNYKLYNYFKYIEATWGKILPFERHN